MGLFLVEKITEILAGVIYTLDSDTCVGSSAICTIIISFFDMGLSLSEELA